MSKCKALIVSLIVSLLIVVFGQMVFADSTRKDLVREHTIEMNRKQNTIRIMAVGDIMMHMPIVNSVARADHYDFKNIFSEIKPFFFAADLVVGNLETTLTDQNGEYSGYPRFKTPIELASDLKNSGFDILTTANNHSYDNGDRGLETTIKALDEAGIMHTGTFVDENSNGLIITHESLKIGLLASTYGTNGLVPNYEYQVNFNDIEMIQKNYDWLVEQGTDIQMIMIHWGNEYRDKPNSLQIDLQNKLREMGFDVVLGSHPHVIQPVIIESSYFCVYSMGNFLSNQRDGFKDMGMIVDLVIEKTDNQIKIRRSEIIPTWVDKYQSGIRDFKIVRLNGNPNAVENSEQGHILSLINHFDKILKK
jgi:poly-gamma-glutamate synthesis protein (capsule biosynthesis protein)